jgi:hypothetical protein
LLIGIGMGFVFIASPQAPRRPLHRGADRAVAPYIAYIVAESLHVSGVLAVVAAGLVRGRHAPEIVSAEMRIMARSVWNVLVFLLNSLVFMLIGMQLSDMPDRLARYSTAQLIGWGLADQRGGDPGALRLGVPGRRLPAALRLPARCAPPSRACAGASWASSAGAACAASSRWRRRWRCRRRCPAAAPSRTRPDHLPDLLRHRRHAGRPGPDAARR